MPQKKKVKRKKTKYRKVTFKLTANQKAGVDRYCEIYGTTPIKLYKNAIKLYVGKVADQKKTEKVIDNQLNLFPQETFKGRQITIFDEIKIHKPQGRALT